MKYSGTHEHQSYARRMSDRRLAHQAIAKLVLVLPAISECLEKGLHEYDETSEVKRKVSGRARGRMVRQRREMYDGREEVGQQ